VLAASIQDGSEVYRGYQNLNNNILSGVYRYVVHALTKAFFAFKTSWSFITRAWV